MNDSQTENGKPESGGYFWTLQKTGFSWIYKRFMTFRLSRRLRTLEIRKNQLLEDLGEKGIDHGMSVEDTELQEDLERLERDKKRIQKKIEEKEETIREIKSRTEAKDDDLKKRIEDLREQLEEQDQKLELNQVSIERAKKKKSNLQHRLSRSEQVASGNPQSTNQPAPQPALEGPSGDEGEESSDDKNLDPEQIEESMNRTRNDLEELRNKRDRLKEERQSIEDELRDLRKRQKHTERQHATEIRRIESDIADQERRLDDIDREKKSFARDFGSRLYQENRIPEGGDKYVRRLNRIHRRIERTHDRLDELQIETEEMSTWTLLLFFLFWILILALAGGGVYLWWSLSGSDQTAFRSSVLCLIDIN